MQIDGYRCPLRPGNLLAVNHPALKLIRRGAGSEVSADWAGESEITERNNSGRL